MKKYKLILITGSGIIPYEIIAEKMEITSLSYVFCKYVNGQLNFMSRWPIGMTVIESWEELEELEKAMSL